MTTTTRAHAPIIAAGAFALALAGCTSSTEEESDATESAGETSTAGTFSTGNEDYDAIINAGAVADDATIEANEWASAVKEAGVLEVGGTETSELFSLLDTASGEVVGFDAGLSQLLSRYILGDVSTNLTQATSDTREDLLETGAVDVVFATYSITEEREERVDFAGPYYQSQAAILVSSDNTDINSVDDLAGKTVATQSGSTGITTLEEYAPEAEILELPDNDQAITAVQQGRADAYVIDESILLNALIDHDDVKIVGEPFGDTDEYGIGLPEDSDAVEFVNTWLQSIIDDGTWLELWEATIQAQTGTDVVPDLPVISTTGDD